MDGIVYYERLCNSIEHIFKTYIGNGCIALQMLSFVVILEDSITN